MDTSPRLAHKVLLIGWDAADWKVINPLMDAGKMPTLERLVNAGVMANLATLHPVLSPMLWTSIATGKRPFKHGVLGFTEPVPDGSGVRPVTNLSRKVKALWNILNQNGYRSNVVGWWPSHPAEPINGAMVSNHYQHAFGPIDQPWPLPPGAIHPRRLVQTLAELRLHPNELVGEQLLPFIPRASDIDQEQDPRLAMVAKILAECTSVHAAATWLMENEPWDFMAVYYDAIDHFCHGFMKYHPPRQAFIPEQDFELYQGVVEAGYRYHDLMLRRLLELAGAGTTVLLVSDHGFHPDHLRPQSIPHEPAGPAVEHRDFGILAMQGPGIKPDEHIYGANLLDITPTILTLFGLPVGEDMDGRPLVEAFEQRPEVATIASWDDIPGDDGRHLPDMQLDPMASQEAINQLIALGYIEKPDDNRERAIANTVHELRYNLARAYMDADLHAQALPLLEALYGYEPHEYRFGIQLAMCYRALERIAELRSLVEAMQARRHNAAEEARQRLADMRADLQRRRQQRAAARPPAAAPAEAAKTARQPLMTAEERLEGRRLRAVAEINPFALELLLAFVDAAEGRHAAALEHLTQAEQVEAERPGLHLQIGEAYLTLQRWQDAERAFTQAMAIDPDNPHAHLGLARSCLAQRRPRRAAAEALTAVGLLYHYPLAHFYLGLALQRLGRLQHALEAYQVAVALNPNFIEAYEKLALLYERRLKAPDQAAAHRRLAEEIRTRRALLPVQPAAPVLERRTAAAADSHEAAPARHPLVPTASRLTPAPSLVHGEGNFLTVVTGLPRSGTSMLVRMLAVGGMPVLTDGVRQADPDNPHGYFEYEPARRLHTERAWLAEAVDKAVKIVAQLLPHLPADYAYRVIFMERNLHEVLASQQAMLERQGRQGAHLSTEQLMQVFASQIRRVQAWLAQQANIQVLCLSYADTLADPYASAVAINRFLGGTLDSDKMAAAVDLTLYRQRAAAQNAESVF